VFKKAKEENYNSFLICKLAGLSLLIFFFSNIISAQKIKIACVGNSVTYGATIKNRDVNSYPAKLQKLLGSDYEVANFGYSGATMLKNGHKPYWEKPVFNASKEFLPNIVIIHLGLNDQGNNNWPKHKDEFESDYMEMIQVYKSLPSKPKIIVCKMSPSFSGHHWFEEGMRESYAEIQNKITAIAKKANVSLLDLHEPLYRFPELYSDDLHPAKEGAIILAKEAYQIITGDYGGLQLSKLYGENMVLQRKEPIVIQGKANAGEKISVVFKNKEKSIVVAENGNWQVIFDASQAGGPYQLKIDAGKSGKKKIEKVFVGEVWLASGQSNMDFQVNAMKHAKSVLKDSLHSNIFLFSMDGKAQPSNHQFTETELKSCNANDYFEYSGWSSSNKKMLENFSAIAYSFAYNLQKELNIPIGIICNAVGGSTTQSWISRETMETTHETIDLLNDTYLNPMVQPWVSGRKAMNLEKMREFGVKARHPFDPTLLFDAGINPIKNYNIKGVIWHQGESNAERVDFHSRLFKLLVQDWRMHWKKPEMPFHFVQLSSINRPTWGHFRDAQRKLLTLPNIGMAVSSDLGHPTDVHPKQKWIVGKRLSKVALANNYGEKTTFSGPLLDFVNVNKDVLEVHFLYADGLKITNGNTVKDILIAGKDKVFVPAQTEIKKNTLHVWSPKVKAPRYVKYGYKPYTEGNLVNNKGWPASTFSNLDN